MLSMNSNSLRLRNISYNGKNNCKESLVATEEWTMGYLQASVENLKTGQEQISSRIDDTNARMDTSFTAIIASLVGTMITLILTQ